MFDYYLKSADEVSMKNALIEASVGILDESQNIQPKDGVSISVIGDWYERVSGTDDAPIMQQVDGWYANVRSLFPITWPSYITQMNPVSPWRVWG